MYKRNCEICLHSCNQHLSLIYQTVKITPKTLDIRHQTIIKHFEKAEHKNPTTKNERNLTISEAIITRDEK